jgi:type III pantothenate kinase
MAETQTIGQVNLIAISVGNTRVAIAAFAEGQLINPQRVGNDDVDAIKEALAGAWAAFEQRHIDTAPVLIGSVHDEKAKRVAALVADELQLDVGWIERDVNAAIGRQLDRESIVGTDRLLNAAAAYDAVKQACVVIDAGTAVTVDFVDGEGTFHGGAILPGPAMQMRSMHEHTAQLPSLSFTKPDEAIGHSTAQAMYTGVFHGIRGAVRELVEKFAEVYGAYPRIIATGGDAHTLFDEYELIENVVDDLTLRGIAVSWHRSQQAGADGDEA